MKIRTKSRSLIAALGAACLSAALASTAAASQISYSLMFSESLDVLKNPTNATLAMNEARKPAHTLALQRTTPFVELRNTSLDAEITSLNLTIGDLSKNFDFGKLIESSPGVSFTLGTADGVMGGATSDNLLIHFTGLGPGEFVRFRMGLSPDDPAGRLIQDFRAILFQSHGPDPSQNALASVSFANSIGQETLTQQLSDFNLTSPLNASIPSLGACCCAGDPITPLLVSGLGAIVPLNPDPDPDPIPEEPGEGPQVPEPSTLSLLVIGALGLYWQRRRRFRR